VVSFRYNLCPYRPATPSRRWPPEPPRPAQRPVPSPDRWSEAPARRAIAQGYRRQGGPWGPSGAWPVPGSSIAAFGRALQRPAVKDHSAKLLCTRLAVADQRAEIGDASLEDAGVDPAAGLLVDGLPRHEISGHEDASASRYGRCSAGQ
jgi:hypothetical protein